MNLEIPEERNYRGRAECQFDTLESCMIGLFESDRSRVWDSLDVIHELTHNDVPDDNSLWLAFDTDGQCYVIPIDQREETSLDVLPEGLPTLRVLSAYLSRLAELVELHEADWDWGEGTGSVSWYAAHNIWHLKDVGGQTIAEDRFNISVDNIQNRRSEWPALRNK